MPQQEQHKRANDTYGDHTPLPHPSPPATPMGPLPRVGDVLDDRYEVREVLGEGGMSTVFGAFDRELERSVAIKILHEARGPSALRDEARVLAAAHSPHVVALYALHLDARPPFLVMERVYGQSLDRILHRDPPGWAAALDLLERIATALDVLHEHGLVHGDVKAANVLLADHGEVKLADMGIAPLLRRAAEGEVYGTPSCIPPERARGLRVESHLLPRGDVYAFGVLAFTMLAGRPPFESTSPHELLRLHASVDAPRLSSVCSLPPCLDEPLTRALAKSPHDRHARAGELVRELRRAARSIGPDGRPRTVLVVDDDDDTRALFVALIATELEGVRLATAASGPEGLEQIASLRPHVILLDLAMPGLNGIPLLARVVEAAPEARVVVVTGLGSGRERTAAARLGVTRFLVKPVGAAELLQTVLEDSGPALRGPQA